MNEGNVTTMTGPPPVPAHLQNAAQNSALSDELAKGGGVAFSTLKPRAGGGWEIVTRDEVQPVLDANGVAVSQVGVAVLAAAPVSKRWYANGYSGGDGSPPTCKSASGLAPDADVANKQSASCAACPLNQWGSGRDQSGNPTKGKACQDRRRMVVVPLHLLDRPLLVDLPPTSFKMLARHIRAAQKIGGQIEVVKTWIQAVPVAGHTEIHFALNDADPWLDENQFAAVNVTRSEQAETIESALFPNGKGIIPGDPALAGAPSHAPQIENQAQSAPPAGAAPMAGTPAAPSAQADYDPDEVPF